MKIFCFIFDISLKNVTIWYTYKKGYKKLNFPITLESSYKSWKLQN